MLGRWECGLERRYVLVYFLFHIYILLIPLAALRTLSNRLGAWVTRNGELHLPGRRPELTDELNRPSRFVVSSLVALSISSSTRLLHLCLFPFCGCRGVPSIAGRQLV
jgi:hypothetical protein